MTIQCCCCEQVRNESGEWVKPERKPDDAISHTYCDACFAEAMRGISEYREYMNAETVAA